MHITKIHIKNFKGYQELMMPLNKGMNIIVGDNEAKKSTILEAINLVLSGDIDGKYLTAETLNDFLFNKKSVDDYRELVLKDTEGQLSIPPSINIDLHFSDDAPAEYEGSETITSEVSKGIGYRIGLRQEYLGHYRNLKRDDLKSLPLELYSIDLIKFSGEQQPRALVPIKNSFIDTSSNFQNASDQAIAKIIKSDLDKVEKISVSQFYRGIKDLYKEHSVYKELNSHVKHIEDTTISIDPSSKNSWDSHLSLYVQDIPFHYTGKGNKTIIKTNISLRSKKTSNSDIVLIEEPENHLSHTRLSYLISLIEMNCEGKQIIITSHSSFIANKLGLENIILLNDSKFFRFESLNEDTKDFFRKLPGYDTLRLLLCKKAILVEGDADELVIQRAYMDKNNGKLPIEDKIDVISVNNTYERFLQLARPLNKETVLIIDVDNKIEARNALKDSLKDSPNIKLFFEENHSKGEYKYSDDKIINKNTLEPLIVEYNSLEVLNSIFETDYKTKEKMIIYMLNHKTDCALKIFSSSQQIIYPKYLVDALEAIAL